MTTDTVRTTIAAMMCLLAGCASPKTPDGSSVLYYSAAEIRGRVVEAETEKPIPGAVVVAIWLLSPTVGFHHEPYVGRLKLLEATTDDDGTFRIPAWGPKPLPPFTVVDDKENPKLGAFKGGFGLDWLYGSKEIGARRATLRLRLFDGTIEERASLARTFQASLERAVDTLRGNDWRSYPRATATLLRERRFLRNNGLKHDRGAPSLPDEARLSDRDKELLRRYEP